MNKLKVITVGSVMALGLGVSQGAMAYSLTNTANLTYSADGTSATVTAAPASVVVNVNAVFDNSLNDIFTAIPYVDGSLNPGSLPVDLPSDYEFELTSGGTAPTWMRVAFSKTPGALPNGVQGHTSTLSQEQGGVTPDINLGTSTLIELGGTVVTGSVVPNTSITVSDTSNFSIGDIIQIGGGAETYVTANPVSPTVLLVASTTGASIGTIVTENANLTYSVSNNGGVVGALTGSITTAISAVLYDDAGELNELANESDSWLWTMNGAILTIQKRANTDNSGTYYPTGDANLVVTPGNNIYYQIIMTNGAGAPATDVTVLDELANSLFVTYDNTSLRAVLNVTPINDPADIAFFDVGTNRIYIGDKSAIGDKLNAFTIPASGTLTITYSVLVDLL